MDPTTTPTRRPARPPERLPASLGERASALVLAPTMVLVLLCLGGLAVDMTLVHSAHRSAHRIASTAADDAAAMIDTEELQRSGELRIDPARARSVALAQIDAGTLPGQLVGRPTVQVDPTLSLVTVTVVIDVDHVMLRALPGADDHERLTVRARARLDR